MQVGIGRLVLRLRHCHSLKDKRSVVHSLVQKLRNGGWSVVEYETQENLKLAQIGMAFVSVNASDLAERFYQADRLLLGDFEVVSFDKETLDGLEAESDEDAVDPENILDERDPD
ncbi:DUF503 domain-containing protein [bacterium]|nr:DUF503 domain-containing protein [bacterium]